MDMPVFERVPGRECQSCRYYVYRADYDDAGECRRRSPQVYPCSVTAWQSEGFHADVDASAKFPPVGNADWCGEFEHATLAARGPRIPLPTVQGMYAVWRGCWVIEWVYKDPSGFFWIESESDIGIQCERGEYVLMNDMSEYKAWCEKPMPVS